MQKKVRYYRLSVQSGFLLLIAFLGYRLYQFIGHYDTGGAAPYVPHPDGVEGFLPIGALTSLKFWLSTGTIHPYHPAALFIFIGAISASLVLRKGFCGWICPVGFISERLYKPWNRFFKNNVRPPRWLDYALRSLKYLLLAFFFWAIVLRMDAPALYAFLDGDYWKVADVKMFLFFEHISVFALVTVLTLALLSVPIRNFWCRYLCPYGALLGLVGSLSPFAITRDDGKCVHCKKCTRNCPAYLPVEAKVRVKSPECTSCMTCLSGCPKGAISYSFRTPLPTMASILIPSPPAGEGRVGVGEGSGVRALPGWAYPAVLLAVFLGVIGLAKLTGHWHTAVTDADFQRLVPIARSLEHPH